MRLRATSASEPFYFQGAVLPWCYLLPNRSTNVQEAKKNTNQPRDTGGAVHSFRKGSLLPQLIGEKSCVRRKKIESDDMVVASASSRISGWASRGSSYTKAQPPIESDKFPEEPSKTTVPAFSPYVPGENSTCATRPRIPIVQSSPGSWMPRR